MEVRDPQSEESKRGEEFERWCKDEITSSGSKAFFIWGLCGSPIHPAVGRCMDCILRSQRDGDIGIVSTGNLPALLFIEAKSFSPDHPDTILINTMQHRYFRGPCRYYAIGEPGKVKIYRADKVVNACALIEFGGEEKFQFNHTLTKPDYTSFYHFRD